MGQNRTLAGFLNVHKIVKSGLPIAPWTYTPPLALSEPDLAEYLATQLQTHVQTHLNFTSFYEP